MASSYRFITTYRNMIRVVAPDARKARQASQSVHKKHQAGPTLFLLQDAGVARTVSQLPRFAISLSAFRPALLPATVFL